MAARISASSDSNPLLRFPDLLQLCLYFSNNLPLDFDQIVVGFVCGLPCPGTSAYQPA